MRSALVTTFKTDRLGGGSVWRKDRAGFQPSDSFLDRLPQGFALGWYEARLWRSFGELLF